MMATTRHAPVVQMPIASVVGIPAISRPCLDAAGRKYLLPTRRRPVGVISLEALDLSAVIGGLHPHWLTSLFNFGFRSRRLTLLNAHHACVTRSRTQIL